VTANLIADWLLTYTVHGVVWGVVAVCAGAMLSAQPVARRRLWRVALFGPLVTSALAVVAYGPNAGNRTVSLTMTLRPLFSARWSERRVESRVEMRVGARPVRTLEVADPLASAASLLVCGLLGAPAVIAGLVLLRRRKRAIQAMDLRPLLLDQTGVSAAVTRNVSLYASPVLDVPLALTRRRICLPGHGFTELDRTAQESVLLHELAHLERHDPAWADASRFLVAVTWWQPLNRLLLRNMERDAELAADVRAVERGAVPAALVTALARFANRLEFGGLAPGVPLVRADSPLVERARRLLDPPSRPQPARIAAITAIALLLAIGSIVALPIPTTAGPIRRSAEIRQNDVRGVSSDDRDVEIVRTVPAP
jgi:hypothetical protein